MNTRRDDFTDLLGKLRDAALSEADAAALERAILADPAAMDRYLHCRWIEAGLTERFGDRTVPVLDTASKPRVATKRTPAISRPTPFIIYPIAIAAAALLTAAIVVVYLLAFTTDPQPDPIKPNQPGPAVATLIEISGGGDLRTPHGYPAEGEDFSAGEYTLSGGGTAEFMLTNAVNVRLRGETRMSMHNDMNVSLGYGSASFVVPKDAKGFTVHLPDRSKVVDLGTAFRVEVDGDGRSKLHVTDGLVEWIGEDPAVDPMRLEAGAVVRIARGQATLLQQSSPIAGLVHEGLSIHYRANDIDGFGNPGSDATAQVANLADPDHHIGVLVNGAGIVRNTDRLGTPFEYGIVLDADKQTHIKTDYQIAGGTNKVTDATWEFWMRADRAVLAGRGALYGEFPVEPSNHTRHYLRLDGADTSACSVLFDEYVPADGSTTSQVPLFGVGEFTQIVVTKRGDTLTFYRDGVQVGPVMTHAETYTGAPVVQTLFGRRASGNESFDGQFNIIRIYDQALTGEQVRANYHAETQAHHSESETADR